MPRRVAETPPDKQIDEYIGSGPFIFRKDEWKPGEKVEPLRLSGRPFGLSHAAMVDSLAAR
jgi:hypothetical protein